jgi:hypothetical protein
MLKKVFICVTCAPYPCILRTPSAEVIPTRCPFAELSELASWEDISIKIPTSIQKLADEMEKIRVAFLKCDENTNRWLQTLISKCGPGAIIDIADKKDKTLQAFGRHSQYEGNG